ncbi:MAG: CinA family protein [Candidatus Omnitrophica bacterium]|nr:CinA family protein [Candidatus Omnitrophota bacterium]
MCPMQLEEIVAHCLIHQKKTLAIAESCSGGLLSHRLTNISGSSSFLMAALVTYSYESKTKLLNVPKKLLEKHGAVSRDVASLMAKNVRKLFKTDFGIGITGIAGPTGGTKTKPVGLVFIALSTKTKVVCLKCHFKGSRLQVKTQTTTQALKLLLRYLS